ncbi:hypothetical protein Pcinc_043883 [Petrolisthes cinctipes]|uniref:Uncharacterized protein n=1 Tax=Petrolisthes cinctipes TaxID=88211 RepID=A0AAE1EFW3_PETCI|nr:hypothetical protein Pcinc_043883 [Petrolisthes cinctipes]
MQKGQGVFKTARPFLPLQAKNSTNAFRIHPAGESTQNPAYANAPERFWRFSFSQRAPRVFMLPPPPHLQRTPPSSVWLACWLAACSPLTHTLRLTLFTLATLCFTPFLSTSHHLLYFVL